MTLDELKNLVQSGECETCEFKETTGQRADACKTLCAFFNKTGGLVVFGVSRKGVLTGQLVSDSTKRDLYEAFSKFEPAVDVETEWIPVDDTHQAIVCRAGVGRRKPYVYDGRPYRRVQSSTTIMSQGEYEELLFDRPALVKDWTAEVVPGATYNDLDAEAIEIARKGFIEKHARRFRAEEVNGWDVRTFLDRARLTRDGRITRTTLLLVGKELSAHLLTPHPAQLIWKLEGEERANEIFYPPFLLSTSALYSRIRNVQVRIQPEGWLISKEVPKYKDESILEALHNCIAHQDYRLNGRIVVTEYVDRLTFENVGGFYEGKPDDYVSGGHTPTRYRNAQLVAAMREVNMIDESGYGIRRLYEWQAERYFPLPDYDTSSPRAVKVTIYGHVVDAAYSSLLIKRGADLRLDDICLLDRIQKKLPVSAESVAHLRKSGLIEGRMPHVHISAKIAELTGQKAEYMRQKARPSAHYYNLLLEFIGKWPRVTRSEINDYIVDEIRGDFSREEKIVKITNWMTYLRKKGKIMNVGSDRDPHWITVEGQGKSNVKSNVKSDEENGKDA